MDDSINHGLIDSSEHGDGDLYLCFKDDDTDESHSTFRGIWTFNGDRRKLCVPSDYRLRWADLFHASPSLVAFLTFAGSHNEVVGCYYPAMPKRITNNLPLVIGFVVSFFLVLFPSKRRGIGYPFLLMRDALYSRRS
ncbi:hypothetical protein RchiOBHm_Chr6g0272601 [Rosa chinensis]|uniref:Uncharacterized protein n=1 Tax=Rosa chinensis TaxID=74649 RepID=A0A2P6PRC2_ROSCH|nr:hypothetical protein RchiOBHm_Chr6g0272601 [Rosa chinensis]